MWELWRNHDVFEDGSPERNLPDAEVGWSPNPAIVPLPDLGMPPMPTAQFMGYPFFIGAAPGTTIGAVPGKRAPQPPLDFDIDESGIIPEARDGGLPRHIVLGAKILAGRGATATRVRRFSTTRGKPRPERPRPVGGSRTRLHDGLSAHRLRALAHLGQHSGVAERRHPPEQVAMKFHQGCLGQPCANFYPTFTPSGAPSKFIVNGLPPVAGAPYADPCRKDNMASPTRTIEYRAAYIQFEMIVNRAKWHDRQARILTLEDDALPTRDGARAPEPLFFRAKSGECIVFNATNLIPKDLNLDDFQIFTPTDIMGQHIHLVKFDVTSSDGAGNGWNYEDGTFSPGEVQERIKANNKFQEENGGKQFFTPKTNPKFGEGPDLDGNKVGDYVGAQTTVQRWWADPLLNTRKFDRTIRTVFTHDHFGPSSHQHHGFYGALVVEKADAVWTALDGSPLGDGTPSAGRQDGGPTSFAANVITGEGGKDSFREFNLAFADFGIVYRPDLTPVNPPGRMKVNDINAEPWALEPPRRRSLKPSPPPTPARSSSTTGTSRSRCASATTRPISSSRRATRAATSPTPSARASTATRSRRFCPPTRRIRRSSA